MRLLPLLLLLLAACAEPADRCARAISRDLRIVNALIDETRLNLARGYAYETEEARLRSGLVLCSGGGNVRFCTSNRSVPRRVPVAVDPAAEQRKLDLLLQRRDALRARGLELCRPT